MGEGRLAAWFKNYKSALSHRDLRLLFSGLIVSATGSWAYNVGLLALVYDRTHSLSWVGAAGLARFVPALVASTYGGVIAERTERIRLLFTADVLCTFWQIGLVLVAAGRGPIGLALVFSALTSVTQVVYNPAVSATIPSIVDESDLVAANALNGTIDNLVVVLGPALGAVLLLLGSPTTAFVANAISFALSAVIVTRIRTRSRPVDVTEEGTAGPIHQMMVGVRTILSRRAARVLVALSALVSFVYGTDTVLFVAVSQRRLGTGSEGFGYLLIGLGIGGIVMALGMDRLSRSPNLAPIIMAGVSLYCLPTALLTVTHSAVIAFLLQIIRGAATLVVDVLAVTALQRSVPSDELARVFGVFWAFIIGSICLGALLAPVFTNAFGLNDGLLTMALGPVAIGLIGYLSLRRIDVTAAVQAKSLAPRVAVLEQLGMFATAHQLVLERLAGVETDVSFDPGALIVREGETADAMYVLVEGEVVVRAHREGGLPDRVICTLTGPAYFGEIGVIERIPRTATVAALTPCECARIEGSDLLEALSTTGRSVSLVASAQARLSVTRASRAVDVDLTNGHVDVSEREVLASSHARSWWGGADGQD